MRHNLTRLLGIFSITLLSLSCNKSLEDYFNPDGLSDHVYWGPIVKMGDGSVRSFFRVSPAGVPLRIGIQFTDAALNGLSQDPMDFEHNMFVLSIPQKAKDLTAFEHLIVDWNPQGHPPLDVYGKPHFDFHFYKISNKQRMMIPPYSSESAAAFDKLPPDGYVPESFMPTPEGVPGMGKHWLDKNAPELNGGTFTKTFIYGTYNGAVNFVEPMVTHEYLSSGTESSTAFDQPDYFAPDKTYYPTKYEITRDAQRHLHAVALTDFRWRQMLY
jgi:hypothetical protein